MPQPEPALALRPGLVVVALVFSALLAYKSTDIQIARLGPKYVAEVQARSHEKAVDGFWNRSISVIYHYRLLPVLTIEAVRHVSGLPLTKALSYTLYASRAAVFVMWFYLFYSMRLRLFEILFAVFFVFYAVMASIYNEDMNHFEPMNQFFYLTFFALLLHGRDRWLLPVVAIGSLAKETAVFMPLLYFAWRCPIDWRRPWATLRDNAGKIAYTAAMGFTSLGIYLLIRWFFSVNSPTGMIEETQHYGWGQVATWFNLTNPYTYIQWAVTFNALLILPFFHWKEKPAPLKRAVVIFCSIFFVAHFITTRQEETRMFLVLLMVLLPMSIDTLRRWGGEWRARLDRSHPLN